MHLYFNLFNKSKIFIEEMLLKIQYLLNNLIYTYEDVNNIKSTFYRKLLRNKKFKKTRLSISKPP